MNDTPNLLPTICLLDQFLLTALYISIHKAINKDKLYGKEGKAPRKIESDFLGVSLPVEPIYHTQLHGAFGSNTKQSEMAG